MSRELQCAAAIGALAVLAATAAAADTDADFQNSFGESFFDAYWHLRPDAAIVAGYYKLADVLVVPDAKFRDKERSLLQGWLEKLHELTPEHLSAANRADWALLDNQLRSELWQLNEQHDWEWRPDSYNVASSFALLLDTEYAPLDQRLRTVLKRLENVPAYYAAAELSVRNPTREHTRLAIEQNRGALDILGSDLDKKISASGLTPEERKLFDKRLTDARRAIKDYADWLEALDAKLVKSGAARSFRLGRGLYDQAFAFANPGGGSAEALYQKAQEERLHVLEKMDALADELWPRVMAQKTRPHERLDKIDQVIAQLSNDHVKPAQYVGYVRDLIPKLEQWVTEHKLIALDPSKPLVVRDTPAYQRGVSIASIESPGPYDPNARTYFNVMPLDTLPATQAESFLREYNNWMSPVFIIHEAIPGHYVQLIYANRAPSRIKAIFGNNSTIEGWAVYSERMMLESGYGANAPELWLMYWKWYLRSVTNTLLDYGVHVLGMSEQEVARILTHEAFQSEKEASGKWRRLQLTSVQLTSYYAGFSQIYAYRETLKKELGERFDLESFHERFLSYGSAPVGIIKELMAQRTLPAP